MQGRFPSSMHVFEAQYQNFVWVWTQNTTCSLDFFRWAVCFIRLHLRSLLSPWSILTHELKSFVSMIFIFVLYSYISPLSVKKLGCTLSISLTSGLHISPIDFISCVSISIVVDWESRDFCSRIKISKSFRIKDYRNISQSLHCLSYEMSWYIDLWE